MTGEFTVMTCNLGHVRGEKRLVPYLLAQDCKGVLDKARVVPDIVAIQEARRVWLTEADSSEPSAELARMIGAEWKAYFFPAYDSNYEGHPTKWQRPAFAGYVRAQQGNAVVSRYPVARWPWRRSEDPHPRFEPQPTATQIGHAHLYSTGDRDTERRNAIVAPFDIHGGGRSKVYVIATHLTTLNGESRKEPAHPKSLAASSARKEEVEDVLRLVDELRQAQTKAGEGPAPIILAGDFNSTVGSPEINRLIEAGFGPGTGLEPTHQKHGIHIDHVFYSDPQGFLQPIEYRVLPKSCIEVEADGKKELVTDHLPVIARFRFGTDR